MQIPVPNVQADIQQGFNQNTLQNGIGGLLAQQNAAQMQMQQGMSDLRFTVAQENCNDRQTFNNGMNNLMMQNNVNTQNIVQSQQQGTQAILDKLCQLEIDGLKSTNEQLRQQLNMAALSASQIQQTATLMQNNNQQTQNLIQRIAPMPVPAYVVTNPWTGATSTGTTS